MVNSFSISSLYDAPFNICARAFFLRYPNPYAGHIVSVDVLSREITPDKKLKSVRLILKRGQLPKWLPKNLVEKAESWVLEESIIDPLNKRLNSKSYNVDHIKLMRLIEEASFTAEKTNTTRHETTATVISNIGTTNNNPVIVSSSPIAAISCNHYLMATKEDYKLDSLPYYDKELENDTKLRDAAAKLIADELANSESRDLSGELGDDSSTGFLTSSDLLRQEMERAGKGIQLDSFDASRYALAEPEVENVSEWKKSYNNAVIASEYQQLRSSNLDLLSALGANAWKLSNHTLDADARSLEQQSEQINNKIIDINRLRKSEQTKIGENLNTLEKSWGGLVSNNLELEVATIALEVELAQLAEREQQLRASLQ
ncbi:hypothetical protein E3Q16_02300 [Wallemia mellicola]|uniref:PRELI/MSF1 domain-containing protein n=1 Tax=Wallemia mellicola TaxID=1708541 RepID=A0AB38MS76_9BASI|nr:hypothetical protein E3Q16_02300 [Wallemia mellicola]TIC63597.1 hypothetical protein E3Q02_02961 [Wallemia mellicola]